MPESFPSYPPYLLKRDLKGFKSVYFPSDVGHDNQEKSFMAVRDKATKCKNSDSWPSLD